MVGHRDESQRSYADSAINITFCNTILAGADGSVATAELRLDAEQDATGPYSANRPGRS